MVKPITHSFIETVTVYAVHDLSAVDGIRAWAMTADNASQMTETRLGDTVSYSVVITDCVSPPEYVTDHRSRFLAEYGDSVTE
jgi:hypothetical protein